MSAEKLIIQFGQINKKPNIKKDIQVALNSIKRFHKGYSRFKLDDNNHLIPTENLLFVAKKTLSFLTSLYNLNHCIIQITE